MAGERTPDTSDSGHRGSSDDEISLREHLQRQLDTQRYNLVEMLNGRTATTDAQHAQLAAQLVDQARYFERILIEQRSQLDERYGTQTKALEAAFAAAERAVAAALLAAEKAVQKAETAADKRFESVNEFRAQLADQAGTFLSRTEADVRITALGDRVEINAKKLSDLELRVQSRLDLSQGSATGLDKAWGYLLGVVGFAGGIVGLIIATS